MKQIVVFKEWAPDLPDLGFDVLTNAKNVIHSSSGYRPQKTLDTSLGTVGASTTHAVAMIVSGGGTKFDSDVYVCDGNNFYVGAAGSNFTARGALATTQSNFAAFVQYSDRMIAVGENFFPRQHTINSTTNFVLLASAETAPSASVIGVVNQFVVLGNINSTPATTANAQPNAIQWSGIDNPTSWPTPNSSTAIAQQAGLQKMDSRWGQVTGIYGGDQHGIVLQTGAITRMTYVGPPSVFQFDLISNEYGSIYRRASVQVGPYVYFISRDGFCRTDGVTVENIGVGRVNKFFADNNTGSEQYVTCAYDPVNHLVCWAHQTSATASITATRLISYCTDTNQWTYSDVALDSLLTPGHGFPSISPNATLMALGTNSILGKFKATAGSAVFETSDAELNPGGRSWVRGIKPNVESSGTAPSMTVRIGYRDDLGSTPTYTSATSANSYNKFHDFRIDAKYVRTELTITGNFDKCTGLVADADPSSDR